MAPPGALELSRRQREILRGVVEEHVATGEPVGSKTLVEHSGLDVSPPPVRAAPAALGAPGRLAPPPPPGGGGSGGGGGGGGPATPGGGRGASPRSSRSCGPPSSSSSRRSSSSSSAARRGC